MQEPGSLRSGASGTGLRRTISFAHDDAAVAAANADEDEATEEQPSPAVVTASAAMLPPEVPQHAVALDPHEDLPVCFEHDMNLQTECVF